MKIKHPYFLGGVVGIVSIIMFGCLNVVVFLTLSFEKGYNLDEMNKYSYLIFIAGVLVSALAILLGMYLQRLDTRLREAEQRG